MLTRYNIIIKDISEVDSNGDIKDEIIYIEKNVTEFSFFDGGLEIDRILKNGSRWNLRIELSNFSQVIIEKVGIEEDDED